MHSYMIVQSTKVNDGEWNHIPWLWTIETDKDTLSKIVGSYNRFHGSETVRYNAIDADGIDWGASTAYTHDGTCVHLWMDGTICEPINLESVDDVAAIDKLISDSMVDLIETGNYMCGSDMPAFECSVCGYNENTNNAKYCGGCGRAFKVVY